MSFIPASFSAFCQTDTLKNQKPSFSLGLQSHYGFIIPHSESIRSISKSNPWGLEGMFSWHYSDIKSQSYCNCFPRLGFSVLYLNFNNKAVLGEAFTIAPFVEPYINMTPKFNSSIRFSAGFAYLNKVYNQFTNPDNLFYSTRFSYILTLNYALHYQMTRHWNMNLAFNYNHISNGGNHQPNKGINFPTVSLGFDYVFKPVDFSKEAVLMNDFNERKHSLRFVFFGTGKTAFQGSNRRYMVYGLNVNYGRKVSRLSILTVGSEFVNDGALKESLKKNNLNPPSHQRFAILGGHELKVGKFSFSQQLGVYIYSPAKAKDPVYQRWGLDYRISKQISVGINLKTHRHVADFMDFRMAYIM